MKLGDIKIESLKLMFVNYNTDIAITDLESYMQEENYASYLVNMTGAINRCFSSIESKGVLPSKAKVLKATDGLASGAFIRFDLSELIDDFYAIDRVVYENDNGEYDGDCDYRLEENTLVLKKFDDDESYTVLYKPSITRVTSLTDNSSELDIPENIASQIPYYVKGDLYRDDEPNEASEARNWYEAAMESILSSRVSRINAVKNVYKQTED
jgi:hypothetical protein